ncbi:MAG: hypothetical protein AAGH92_08445 [Planctomycetota bacterium]
MSELATPNPGSSARRRGRGGAAVMLLAAAGCGGLVVGWSPWWTQPPAAMAQADRPDVSEAKAETTPDAGLRFGEAEKLAKLDGSMRESSGLAASRTRPGRLWTHGDSGGGPWLMRFDPWHGQPERWAVRGGSHRDWEDMASFEMDGRAYLLIADTGDNDRNRKSVALHFVEEPEQALGEPADTSGPVPVLETRLTMHVTFADGARDCEAVAVDTATSTVWLLSKEINGRGQMFGRSGLYGVALPPTEAWPDADPTLVGSPAAPLVLDRLATLDTVMPTAMDVTSDGSVLLVGTYGDGLLFKREPAADPDWSMAVSAGPTRVPMPPRRQGEGLCFAADGGAVFLSSETSEQPVWRVPIEAGGHDASR